MSHECAHGITLWPILLERYLVVGFTLKTTDSIIIEFFSPHIIISTLILVQDKLKQYPNAREEKAQLAMNRQRILETQTIFEGPMPILPKRPAKLKSSLETILEVSLQRENAKTKSYTQTKHHSQESKESTFFEEIPKADEQLASGL